MLRATIRCWCGRIVAATPSAPSGNIVRRLCSGRPFHNCPEQGVAIGPVSRYLLQPPQVGRCPRLDNYAAVICVNSPWIEETDTTGKLSLRRRPCYHRAHKHWPGLRRSFERPLGLRYICWGAAIPLGGGAG